MSKRLQVLLKEAEYREIQRAARARHLTVAQWVREALQAARRREPLHGPDRKIEAVRAAVRFEFPTANIDRMLAEIEAGYGARKPG